MGVCYSLSSSARVAPLPDVSSIAVQKSLTLTGSLLADPQSISADSRHLISSCFVLIVYIPPDAVSHGLAVDRHSRGHGFLIGDKVLCSADKSVTYWRNVTNVGARILLVFSHRGGLELPGGRRNKGESLAAAAQRELEEESGLKLAEPLQEEDALLTTVDSTSGKPRWQLYMRVVRDEKEFCSAKFGVQPIEAWGVVGVPLTVEDLTSGPSKVNGFPRALAAMPPWQAELLLPLLVKGGILSDQEALMCAKASDDFLSKGGMRASKISPVPLRDALAVSLASFTNLQAPKYFAPISRDFNAPVPAVDSWDSANNPNSPTSLSSGTGSTSEV